MRAPTWVDEVDAGEIPPSHADRGPQERAVYGGQLVAHAGDGDRAVASALLTRRLHAESAAELVARRARTSDARPSHPTVEWRLPGLAVDATVVLLLNPGLCGPIQ